jgi:hypothetical protein
MPRARARLADAAWPGRAPLEERLAAADRAAAPGVDDGGVPPEPLVVPRLDAPEAAPAAALPPVAGVVAPGALVVDDEEGTDTDGTVPAGVCTLGVVIDGVGGAGAGAGTLTGGGAGTWTGGGVGAGGVGTGTVTGGVGTGGTGTCAGGNDGVGGVGSGTVAAPAGSPENKSERAIEVPTRAPPSHQRRRCMPSPYFRCRGGLPRAQEPKRRAIAAARRRRAAAQPAMST